MFWQYRPKDRAEQRTGEGTAEGNKRKDKWSHCLPPFPDLNHHRLKPVGSKDPMGGELESAKGHAFTLLRPPDWQGALAIEYCRLQVVYLVLDFRELLVSPVEFLAVLYRRGEEELELSVPIRLLRIVRCLRAAT